MKLCVPLSDAFRSRQEVLLPLVDAVTFKQPGEESFSGKSHFLESSFNLGDPGLRSKVEESGLLAALHSGKYESFACDIGPISPTKREYSKNGYPRAVLAGEPVPEDVYLRRAEENAQWLRGHFDGHVHVENLNYFPSGGYERVCEPEFIRRATEAAEVGLLLDLAHAVISAHNLGYSDALAYIGELPLDRVREIHLSHPEELAGVLEDLHEVPGEGEIELVRAILARNSAAEYLTVEYYRDINLLLATYRNLALAFGASDAFGGINKTVRIWP